MACTTILVGKKASYDGSTLVARNEDSPSGKYNAKHLAFMDGKDQVKTYRAVLSSLVLDLPDSALSYTYMPNSDSSEGIWGAYGVNSVNVSMTATETLTSNERVLGADPLTREKDGRPAGLGEEDLVSVVLPYIHSAKEGVCRLGQLLAEVGTYEMNGIAFQDEDEIWWLETVGGHHWIAKRVPDDHYVIMANQLGIDSFDLEDAFGPGKNHLCSADLKEFIADNHLDLSLNPSSVVNPRYLFGSRTDADHVYNTPRVWVGQRYLNGESYQWDGEDADFKPEDDDLYWSMKPDRKVTLDDVKRILSDHYQGTPYDVYSQHGDRSKAGQYRPIGINRNNVLGLVQIRPTQVSELKSLQWIAYGSNVFNVMVVQYPHGRSYPAYLSKAHTQATTTNLYWASRIIAGLADANYHQAIAYVEGYQKRVGQKMMAHIKAVDEAFIKEKPRDLASFFDKANQVASDLIEKESIRLLDELLYVRSQGMKNAYGRSDG